MRDAKRKKLSSWRGTCPGHPAAERRRHNGAKIYHEAIKRSMQPVFDRYCDAKGDFFGGNALRYLGLNNAPLDPPRGQRPPNPALPDQHRSKLSVAGVSLNSTPRERLRDFYKAASLEAKAASVFAAIDTVSPAPTPSGACT